MALGEIRYEWLLLCDELLQLIHALMVMKLYFGYETIIGYETITIDKVIAAPDWVKIYENNKWKSSWILSTLSLTTPNLSIKL